VGVIKNVGNSLYGQQYASLVYCVYWALLLRLSRGHLFAPGASS